MTNREILNVTYTQYLGALGDWLRKAAAGLGDTQADALLSARLAPDMFPLATQVRFVCVQAIEGMHRIRGEQFPELVTELLDEGRSGGEAPGTIGDALARIDQTLALIESLGAGPGNEDGSRPVAHELPMGLVFDMTQDQYLRDWALPQFYFHLVTAYAILRSGGVALGKLDYVSHMFGFVRPGTMPPGMGQESRTGAD